MRRSFLLLMILSTVLFTSCDAFRRLAGRPMSADIEAKKAAILAVQEAEHQARMDSLKRVEKQVADSLAVLDSLKSLKITLSRPTINGGLDTDMLEHRYYVVVGSFMDKGNAAYLAKKVEKHGYTATLINFRNGYTAVGICPSDNIVEAFDSLKKVKEEPFSPKDEWILSK